MPSDRHLRVAVRDEDLDPTSMLDEVRRPDSGAIALFLGTVRDHSEERTGVTHLVYEAYTEHVESKIREILHEAADKWPIQSAAVEHRIGRVDLGGTSVAVAVSTAHREDAFEAARYLIDQLKRRAPIWKQENWPGGEQWIEGA